ncbi:type II toxin-antitoxin system RelE/ParE family toxin [Salinisphaera sp.]|uniref:type II toxin-antitoxin system RelE/ParE family toxin n=1 Tax=Salinisphaera sp. TaxID=1914330 RepID=UPI002D78273A|nr:type II toxin-antitoxin system RelE/ParE family toxin [Salinisphaera sp.]HET7314497.1 type II toxin-antitoxin system RelE/ParE family toxin [Salinisphaera sp.]
MLAYEFHPLAEKELDEAVGYYEALEFGKGHDLLRQVEAAIEQVRQFPKSAPISRGSVRSLVVQPSQRWSYTLHYRATSSVIRILAVAHQKRQPFYWLQRQ